MFTFKRERKKNTHVGINVERVAKPFGFVAFFSVWSENAGVKVGEGDGGGKRGCCLAIFPGFPRTHPCFPPFRGTTQLISQ